jgi:hypothetical protein
MKFIVFVAMIAISCNSNSKQQSYKEDSANGYSNSDYAIDSIEKNSLVGDTTNLISSPIKIISSRPVTKEYSSYKDIAITYKNVSNKKIEAIRFKWYGINSFSEPADMGASKGLGGGFIDRPLGPGKTTTSQWSILSKDLKRVIKAWPYEVVFEDGTTWAASK